jgi:hypothetical protein
MSGDTGAELGALAVRGEVTPPRNLGGRPPNPIARLKREAQAELDRRACEAGGPAGRPGARATEEDQGASGDRRQRGRSEPPGPRA